MRSRFPLSFRLALGALLLTLLALTAGSETPQADAFYRFRIMPLGDSITSSRTGHASYRYWLWHQLRNAGYKVDFVGSQYGVVGGPPLYPRFDQDHEGHTGWRADEIADNITAWATTYQPDIVLLLIGSSDLQQGQSISTTVNDIHRIIMNLRAVKPHVTVFLALLTPTTANYAASIPRLNHRLAKLALLDNQPRARVTLVDQYTGFDPIADTDDGTHPNQAGEQKLAQHWFEGLETRLSKP